MEVCRSTCVSSADAAVNDGGVGTLRGATMIFKLAFVTRAREIVRVLRGLPPDDAVRERTQAINEQLARLRATRIAQEKQREEAALKQVQFVIEEMEHLKESLSAVEEATVEFVNQIGDHAQAQLEEEWEKKAETLMAEVMTQQISDPAASKAVGFLPQESSQKPLVETTKVTSPKG